MTVRTRNPDWQDIEAILRVVFDSTGRDTIQRAVRTHLQAQIPSGTLRGQTEDHFPSVDPKWGPNDPANEEMIARYQKLV